MSNLKKKTHILQQSRTFFSKVSLKQNKLHCKLQKYQSRGASSGPLKQDASLHSTHRFCRAPRCPLLSRRFVDGSWRRCFGPPAPGRSRERTGAPLRRSWRLGNSSAGCKTRRGNGKTRARWDAWLRLGTERVCNVGNEKQSPLISEPMLRDTCEGSGFYIARPPLALAASQVRFIEKFWLVAKSIPQ